MRKLMLLALLALSFFAAPNFTQASDPIPECDPCPWYK
jgi:hypothetical protein